MNTFREQKSNGAIASPQIQTRGNVSIGDTHVSVFKRILSLFSFNINITLQQTAQETGVSLEALCGILASMGETACAKASPEEIERLLKAKAKEYLSLLAQLQTFVGNDPEVQRLREAAWQALQAGHLPEAEDLLCQARRHVHEAGQALRVQEATIAAEQAEAAKLQPNPASYRKAANLFGEAASLIATDDALQAREYRLQQASVIKNLGHEFGDNDASREAITLYRQILSGIERTAEPLAWARTQNNLGTVLQTLGERESGTACLEEAVAAFREALKERTRERVPLDWAMTQNNLGNALQTLGARENGTVHLEEAVAAYREALKERTREHVPLNWATTQNNLGGTLQRLGERESGTVRLEESVAAYREALKERIRERVPLYWAITQNNLGNALETLGERESGTVHLEKAVAAFREALAVFKESGASYYVEGTSRSLARAMMLLYVRQSS
jgi:tetratricopeptide (TPR) repeat protein